MATAVLARAGPRKLTRKQRVLQSRASGNVARRASLAEYLGLLAYNITSATSTFPA